MTVTVFTTAPEAADYAPTSRSVEEFSLQDFVKARVWRKVEITTEAYRIAYQCDRYASFLGGSATIDDPRKVSLGDRRPAPTNR